MEIAKNTVSAVRQVKDEHVVQIVDKGAKCNVLFIGNSITRHAPKEAIGWSGNWGMAASAPEKDYVHILMEKIKKKHPDAVFCVFQISSWEANYKNPQVSFNNLLDIDSFVPDITVLRIIENCPHGDFDGEIFKEEYSKLINKISKGSKTVITDGFWRHPGDSIIKEVADENGYSFVQLGDLGDQAEMRAVGLFRHGGVAAHPGDKGMAAIADRIFEKVEKYL